MISGLRAADYEGKLVEIGLESLVARRITTGDHQVHQVGDVVAQLAKATGRHQTEDAAVPGSNPAPPKSPERGQDIRLCII
jgi:hypothetical protein